MATYVFYALVTASAAGIFGASFLDIVGVWNNQPDWAGFLVGGIALALALALAIVPARRATSVLLSVEGITVALILVVAAVVLVAVRMQNAIGSSSRDSGTPVRADRRLLTGIINAASAWLGITALNRLATRLLTTPSRDSAQRAMRIPNGAVRLSSPARSRLESLSMFLNSQ
mgnify:CR=1 FL=1